MGPPPPDLPRLAVNAFRSREGLILKNLPWVSNCWLSTPNNLGADLLPYTSCSGPDCEDSGRNGRSLSSWLPPEPLSVAWQLDNSASATPNSRTSSGSTSCLFKTSIV